MKLNELTAHEIHDLLVSKQVSCREVVEAVLQRIEEAEPATHSFLSLGNDEALKQADEVDAKLARGESLHPLEGIPLALKDILCTQGWATTCASKILEGYVPPYDATVVQKLKEAGVIIVGKTNMDEFAMGSSTENSAFGPTRNPWALDRVPGGSSGGSAAALAANEAILAIGTDTGGSIRQPASLCGVVGLKPTYGRVSRYGLIAFASSLDQVGPLTKDVRDAALLLQAIAGYDRRDSTSFPAPVPNYEETLVPNVKGLRIGVLREFFEHEGQHLDASIAGPVQTALKTLEDLGVRCQEISLPHLRYAIPTYYLIAPAEASSNLARYDGVQYGFRYQEPNLDVVEMYSKTRAVGLGAEVKRRIMLGTYALSAGYYDAYYLKGQQVRTLMREDFRRAFEEVDVLIGPTSPVVAFSLGERTEDPLAMYLADIYTTPTNLAGLPGISLPCGFADGLPVGMQIIGRALEEATLLRVAYAFEQATTYHLRRDLPVNGKQGKGAIVMRTEK